MAELETLESDEATLQKFIQDSTREAFQMRWEGGDFEVIPSLGGSFPIEAIDNSTVYQFRSLDEGRTYQMVTLPREEFPEQYDAQAQLMAVKDAIWREKKAAMQSAKR